MKAKIEQIYKDQDGWWVILRKGWTIDGCVGIREETRKQLLERIRNEAVYKKER